MHIFHKWSKWKEWVIKKLGGITETEAYSIKTEAIKKEKESFEINLKAIKLEVPATYLGNINKVLLEQSGFINKICDVLKIKRLY